MPKETEPQATSAFAEDIRLDLGQVELSEEWIRFEDE